MLMPMAAIAITGQALTVDLRSSFMYVEKMLLQRSLLSERFYGIIN